MSNRKIEMEQVRLMMATWISTIRLHNYETYYDINKVSEHLCRQLLNELYEYELEDLNKTEKNFSGLDLGDKTKSKIAYQVTSRLDRGKINGNLKTVVKEGYEKTFIGGIRFLILNDTGKIDFPPRSHKPENILKTFDKTTDIIYPQDLLRDIEQLWEDAIMRFYKIKQLFTKEIAVKSEAAESISSDELRKLTELLEKMTNQPGDDPAKDLKVSSAFFFGDLSVPKLSIASPRTALVDNTWTDMQASDVTWIHGTPSIGKTSLACLLTKKAGDNVLWLECRDIEPAQFIEHLFTLLANYFETPLQRNYTQTLQAIFFKVEAGTLIVINDTPDMHSTASVEMLFLQVLESAVAAGVKILITSNHVITKAITNSEELKTNTFSVPPFTEDDTAAVLTKHGADADTANLFSGLVTKLTDGHPLLVSASAKYLSDKNWSVETETITALFSGKFGDVQKETYQKLLQNTTDEQTRELLYRFRLISGAFDLDTINSVAAVSPAITHPLEKLASIKDVWLQIDENNSFHLSPLIKKLDGNLAKATEQKVYLELGNKILAKGNISQIQAAQVIFYFILAGQHNRAAFVLLRILSEFMQQPSIFFDWGFDLYWYAVPFPADLAPLLKVQIRVFQTIITQNAGKDTSFLITDLEKIVTKEDVGPVGLVSGNLFLFQNNVLANPIKALEELTIAEKAMEELKDTPFTSDGVYEEQLDAGVWLTFSQLYLIEDYRKWFSITSTMKLSEGALDPYRNQVYAMAGFSIYRRAVLKNKETGSDVEAVLHELVTLSASAGFILLAVYAIKTLIMYIAGDKNDLAGGVAVVEKYREIWNTDPLYEFLVLGELGRKYFHHGDLSKADEYLAPLQHFEPPSYYTEFLDQAISFLQVSYKLHPENCPDIAMKALKISQSAQEYLVEDKIKLFGEVAIGKTAQCDFSSALNFYATGYEMLLDNWQNSDDQKATVIRFGNAIKYITEKIEKTDRTDFGEGKNIVPEPGYFYWNNDSLLKTVDYFEERNFMGAIALQRAFEGDGDEVNAKKWAYKSIELAAVVAEPQFIVVLQPTLFYLTQDQQYRQAYQVMTYIEKFYTELQQKIKAGTVTDTELIKRAAVIKTANVGMYHFLLMPTAFTFSLLMVKGATTPGEFQEKINAAFSPGEYNVQDEPTYAFLKQVFERVIIDKIDYQQFTQMLKTYIGEQKLVIQLIGYILLSGNVRAIPAAQLHLAIVNTIDILMRSMEGVYRFCIVPYFENYWETKINNTPQDFANSIHLQKKGLPLIQRTNWLIKIPMIFRILSDHLPLQVDEQMQHYIDKSLS